MVSYKGQTHGSKHLKTALSGRMHQLYFQYLEPLIFTVVKNCQYISICVASLPRQIKFDGGIKTAQRHFLQDNIHVAFVAIGISSTPYNL